MTEPDAQTPATAETASHPASDPQVIERVIERTADPATGVVTERIVQTTPVSPAAPTVSPAAPTIAAAPAPRPAAAPALIEPNPAAPHAPPSDLDETYYDGSPLLRGEFSRVALYGLGAIVLFLIPLLVYRFSRTGMPSWWHWWITAGFIIAGLVVLVIPFILTKSVRYRVTNYRISWERGVLSKDIDTLELWHVEDLTFRQTIYQRLMGVGTIHILSHDRENPNLVLESVPHARKLFSTLQQRVIAVKRTGGVVKLDSGS